MNKKKNNLIFKKIKSCFFVVFLTLFLFFPTIYPAQAGCLGYPCDELLRQAYQKIQDKLLSVVKQQAAMTVDGIVSNGAGKNVIADWEDFLYKNAEKNAKNILNDYLTNTVTGGKGSLSNYIPIDVAKKIQVNDDSEGIGECSIAVSSTQNNEGIGKCSFLAGLIQNDPEAVALLSEAQAKTFDLSSLSSLANSKDNYVNQLIETAKKATFDKSSPVVTYVGDPLDMFKNGTFKNLSTYTTGINNPWAFQADAESKYEKIYEDTVKKAEVMGISGQGFVGKIKDGLVQTPGSIIAGATISAKDIGNKILASARSIPEVLIASVTNLAASAVNDALSTARSTVQDQINKHVTSARKNLIGT